MEDTSSIVIDLNTLIIKYGTQAVKHALNYIDTFPAVDKIYLFTDGTNTWRMNQEQFIKIQEAYSYSKINAIKVFREITFCGLKEAEDAIENFYKI